MSTLKETTTVTSTAIITLLGAVSGFSAFAGMLAIGSTVQHVEVYDDFGNWEISTYIMSDAVTLARQSVETSSNGGQPVVFGAGIKTVLSSVADSQLLPVARFQKDPINKSIGLVDSAGKMNGRNAFDLQFDGQTLAAFAGDGAASLVSANAGEAVSVQAVGGIPMLKCTLSTAAAALFQADYTLTAPVYLGYANSIQIPIRFSDMSPSEIATSTVQMWLYTEGTSTNVRAQLSMEMQEPGLFVASFSRDALISGATPITQLDVDRISKVRILITSGSSSVAKAPVYIGPITANRRRSKGRVLIYFDGQYDSQSKYLLPMLDRYGLKANLAITNKDIGGSGRMTLAQLAAAYAAGHTICHHTFGNKTNGWDSTSDYPDQSSITADIASQWAFLIAQGWGRGVGHCVNGYTNAFTNTVDNGRQTLVSAGLTAANVKTCRVGGVYLKASGGGVGHLFPAAHKNANWRRMFGGIQITSTDTAASVQAVIDAAEKRGELASILLHRSVVDTATPGSLEMKNSDCNTWIEYLADRCSRGGLINETVDSAYANLAVLTP